CRTLICDPARAWGDVTGARAATPLIVTAALPRDLHRWATALRREHYPPERNVLEAHVTLFHGLPPSLEAEARRGLARMGSANRPVPARLTGLRALGDGGTAIE